MPPTLLSMRPNLPVRDVSAAVAFYRDVLGFGVKAQFPDGSFALLESGGAELALVRHESPQPQGAYLYVKGVEELLAPCTAAGHTISYPLTTEPWGIRNFVVLDPDGHAIAIGERVE
ncbi:MAG TPA: VOC family protein [Tepidiformaceae bacterium]|nr:VOC family protein [Tepidiformaceae bacterium]HMO95356.1 VOC family protein [Tepidiformaceae bacterium]